MADERAEQADDIPMLIGGTMPADVDGIGLRYEQGRAVIAFWYLDTGGTRELTPAEKREWFAFYG